MAHYAKVVNGIVEDVIVADKEFINSLPEKDFYIQTSYNTRGGKHYKPNSNEEDDGIPLRKNYAGIGYFYNKSLDAFIPPKPHNSWKLNEETCLWEAPISKPDNENFYVWSEKNIKWLTLEEETEERRKEFEEFLKAQSSYKENESLLKEE
jgi:hypothetical protein